MLSFLSIDKLSTTDLIGECMMPRLDVETFISNEAYREATIKLVREHKTGGFCVFAEFPESVVEAVTTLQNEAMQAREATAFEGIPLLFSCDCEFGLRMRLKHGGTEFPDAMAMAKSANPELVRQVGEAIAREMRTLGLDWNFAPVADVNSNPKNPIINTRSFGDDPETVIQFAVPFMQGLQSAGVAGCAKHFPGHGDTAVDSHHELPFIEEGSRRFDSVELPPFEALVRAGVGSVMTGHLACPDFARELGGSDEQSVLPATLSRTLTTILLRERLGFTGVIVTDAMEMHAITKLFGDGEAAVRALEAGADVLLMPVEPEGAFVALVAAVEKARISREEVEEKVKRIWEMRVAAFGHRTHQSDLTNPSEENALQSLAALEEAHLPLSQTIARNAIRLTGKINLLGAKLIIIADDRPQATGKAEYFAKAAARMFEEINTIMVSQWQSSAVEISDDTVIATFHRARGYLGGTATDWTLPRIMAAIGGSRPGMAAPRGLILIGSPYLGQDFERAPGFVLKTFSESIPSIDAALERLNHAE